MSKQIYLDFEMNKYRDGPSEIIAIGAVKVENDIVIDRFYSLISMQKGFDVCVHVSILTGITTRDLEAAPSFNTIFKQFSEWCEGAPVYCWGDFDKTSLDYTYRLNRNCSNAINKEDIKKFNQNIIDLEKRYGYDKIYHKASLKDIILSLNTDFEINNRKLHQPTYDAELLHEFHKQVKRPNC